MIYNELAEKFNEEVKALDKLIVDKKYDEAMKHIESFEKEMKPILNSCEMTCSDFADREKFNLQLRQDAMDGYASSQTSEDKKYCAEMYNMAQKELYELWTSWKAVVKQFENAMSGWKAGIKQTMIKEQQAKPQKA